MGPPPATVEMFCARAARGAVTTNARARSFRKRMMFWVPSLLIKAGKGDLKNVSRQFSGPANNRRNSCPSGRALECTPTLFHEESSHG
jgi:hypothetical protein